MAYAFTEEQFEPDKNRALDYSAVKAVWTDSERYYLFLNKNIAYLLRKDSFVTGAAEDFGPFLKKKTGLPIQNV